MKFKKFPWCNEDHEIYKEKLNWSKVFEDTSTVEKKRKWSLFSKRNMYLKIPRVYQISRYKIEIYNEMNIQPALDFSSVIDLYAGIQYQGENQKCFNVITMREETTK